MQRIHYFCSICSSQHLGNKWIHLAQILLVKLSLFLTWCPLCYWICLVCNSLLVGGVETWVVVTQCLWLCCFVCVSFGSSDTLCLCFRLKAVCWQYWCIKQRIVPKSSSIYCGAKGKPYLESYEWTVNKSTALSIKPCYTYWLIAEMDKIKADLTYHNENFYYKTGNTMKQFTFHLTK